MLSLDSNIDLALFFKWWGGQLSFLVPQKFLDAVSRGKSLIVVEVQATTAKLSYLNDEQETALGEFEFNDIAKEALHQMIEKNSNYRNAKIVLRVPKSQSVIQTVFLPVAAADNLQQVMSYELDRYTPFTKEQVYFDVINQGVANNKALLQLVLVLVQKNSLDTMYQQCLSLGLQPSYADSVVRVEKMGSSQTYNLLPKEQCQKVSKRPLFIMLGSLATMLALLTALILLPLNQAEQRLNDLKKHVRKVEKTAIEIEDSKKSIDYLYQATQNIVDKKNGAPSIVMLINTVTKVLADDTWVSNLRYFNKTLQLSGQSGSASNLIGSLETTKLFSETKFISPVTKDSRTGLERYKISTKVKQTISGADADTE